METREERDAAWAKGFAIDGEEQVRALISAGNVYSTEIRQAAIRWLTKQDQERSAREAEEDDQRAKSDRYAKIRDDIAAAAAVIAAIAAIVGAFISYASWIHPRAP